MYNYVYLYMLFYIICKNETTAKPQPSINRNTAHTRLITGGWTVGGEFGDVAVVLLLLSSISRARFESTLCGVSWRPRQSVAVLFPPSLASRAWRSSPRNTYYNVYFNAYWIAYYN